MDDDHPAVRRAERSDARKVADVWLRSRHASTPSIPPPVHDDDDVRAWFENVVLPKHDTWVIERDAEIAGLLVLDAGCLDQLYVEPAWTGHGLGSTLLEFAKAARPGGLDLWTFQANGRARRFYERHGFVTVDETDGDNEEGAPDVRYHWSGELAVSPIAGSRTRSVFPDSPGAAHLERDRSTGDHGGIRP